MALHSYDELLDIVLVNPFAALAIAPTAERPSAPGEGGARSNLCCTTKPGHDFGRYLR